MTKFHFSHMVEISPWPLLGSVGGLGLVSCFLMLFFSKTFSVGALVLVFIFFIS